MLPYIYLCMQLLGGHWGTYWARARRKQPSCARNAGGGAPARQVTMRDHVRFMRPGFSTWVSVLTKSCESVQLQDSIVCTLSCSFTWHWNLQDTFLHLGEYLQAFRLHR